MTPKPAPVLRFARLAGMLALGVVAILGWALVDSTERGHAAVRWVAHTEEVLHTIDQADEQVLHAETAQRGYLLTGAAEMLQVRNAALARVDSTLGGLARMTADNPAQQARVQALAQTVADRRELMEESSALRQGDGLQAALEHMASGRPERARQRMREASHALQHAERELLESRGADLRRSQANSHLAIGAVLLALPLLLIPGYVSFAREAKRNHRLERQLQELSGELPVALYQLRRTGNDWQAEYFSERCATIHAVDIAAAQRDPLSLVDTVHAEDQPALQQKLCSARAEDGRFEAEYRLATNAAGVTRWLRSSATLRADGDSLLFTGYWSDITEQKALAAELELAHREAEAANRAKSAFLATMSHEIRTPMNGVLGMLELLDLTRLDADQRATLSLVRESGRSLLRIIDDILDFSKIDAGQLELNPEVVAVPALLQRLCQLHTGSASSKGLVLSCTLDPAVGAAHRCDPLRLGQILNNLLSNAIKFTDAGSIEVQLSLLERTAEAERVRIRVQDSGIGISDEQRALLFRPFAQASSHIAGRYGGTGLGLSICRRLAELMGGRIELTSKAGRGTTAALTLTLPIAAPELLRDSGEATRHETLASTLASRRIPPRASDAVDDRTLVLVVDDHPINRVVLQRQIETLGYAVEVAEDGEQGLQQWRSRRFGLVLTDCQMPVLDGYAMTRALRAEEARLGLERIPVIACTANALRGEAEVCADAGMDDFLSKPVALHALMTMLDRWLPLPDTRPMALDPLDHEGAPTGTGDDLPLASDALAELSLNDPQAEREILVDFRRINDQDAVLLRRAAADRDLPQVIRLAHRIKGSSRMVGARPLAEVCARIERTSRSGDAELTAGLMEQFQYEMQRLNQHLDQRGA